LTPGRRRRASSRTSASSTTPTGHIQHSVGSRPPSTQRKRTTNTNQTTHKPWLTYRDPFTRLRSIARSASCRSVSSGMAPASRRHRATSRATALSPQSNSRVLAAASTASWCGERAARLAGELCGLDGARADPDCEISGYRNDRKRCDRDHTEATERDSGSCADSNGEPRDGG
jgi:hypothetical protein